LFFLIGYRRSVQVQVISEIKKYMLSKKSYIQITTRSGKLLLEHAACNPLPIEMKTSKCKVIFKFNVDFSHDDNNAGSEIK